MSDLRAEAISLINKMPDSELAEIVPDLRERRAKAAREAYERIHQIISQNKKNLPADFDYERELEEVREEQLHRYENLG